MAGCCREGRGDLGVGVWVVSSLESLPDDELVAEREMLDYARRCLAAMRRRTRSLRAAGADPSAVESVEWRLRQRVAALTDDGRTGLFFGRLDYDASADPPDARFYVGRRHVSDAEGDPGPTGGPGSPIPSTGPARPAAMGYGPGAASGTGVAP
jgi:hypothetical protein